MTALCVNRNKGTVDLQSNVWPICNEVMMILEIKSINKSEGRPLKVYYKVYKVTMKIGGFGVT